MNPDDDDLQSRFDALRRIDEAGVPELTALVAKPRASRRSRVAVGAAFAAAAVILVVVSLRFSARPAAQPTAPSILAWRSPTASLLQTPGLELMRTVPTLRSTILRNVPPGTLVKLQPGA